MNVKKVLVYKVEIVCDPATANPAAIVEALAKYGKAEIVGSHMRKLED